MKSRRTELGNARNEQLEVPAPMGRVLRFDGAAGLSARIYNGRQRLESDERLLFEAVNRVLCSLIGLKREKDGAWSFRGAQIFVNGWRCVVIDFPYYQYGAQADESDCGTHVLVLMRHAARIKVVSASADDDEICFSLPIELVDAELPRITALQDYTSVILADARIGALNIVKGSE